MATASVKRKTANKNASKSTASRRVDGRKATAIKSRSTKKVASKRVASSNRSSKSGSSNTPRGRHSVRGGSRSTASKTIIRSAPAGRLSRNNAPAGRGNAARAVDVASADSQAAQTSGDALTGSAVVSKRYKIDLIALVLGLCAVLLAISLYVGSLGPAGVLSRHSLGMFMGVTRFALPPLFLIVAVYIVVPTRLLNGRVVRDLPWQTGASVVVLGCVSGLADIAGGLPGISAHSSNSLLGAGGWIGVGIGGVLDAGIGTAGAVIVLTAIGLFSLLVVTGITLRQVFRFVAGMVVGLWNILRPKEPFTVLDQPNSSLPMDYADECMTGVSEFTEANGHAGFAGSAHDVEGLHTVNSDESDVDIKFHRDEHSDHFGNVLYGDEDSTAHDSGMSDIAGMNAEHTGTAEVGNRVGIAAGVGAHDDRDEKRAGTGETTGADNYIDGGDERYTAGIQQKIFSPSSKGAWKLPPTQLLSRSVKVAVDRRDIENIGRALVGALATHGVETRLSGFTVGPTVTRYELELGPGVKVAKVTSLSKDIAYAMASPDVRILAPIPGKSAIGIEVPNRERELITLGDLLSTKEAKAARHPLSIPLGRDISGKSIMTNLADMPHLLISGATGSGKSSFINSMITGILLNATPDQVRLILIDPKRVELGPYKGLPHLLTEVVVDPRKAANALAWAVDEMDRRYRLLAEVGARDIAGYNETVSTLYSEPVDEPVDLDDEQSKDGEQSKDDEYLKDGEVKDDQPKDGQAGVAPVEAEDALAEDGDGGDRGFDDSEPGDCETEDARREALGAGSAGAGDCEFAHLQRRSDIEEEAIDEELPNSQLEQLPYIVVVVDELNDLMMVAARDVEESVCRIAQMARAVGIHLVLATQRPSVDVITGVIKANIPSRLAFAVSSLADSRVILDQPGAERLIGKGDMLMLTASSSVPRRIQGAWVDTHEVHSVVAYWKRQGSLRHEIDLGDAGTSVVSSSSSQDDDDLVDAALELVVNAQLGSTSMLQRKLKVGFARAGRLMDILERKGVVGPSEGSKARAVLMTPEELSEMRARQHGSL